MFENKKSVMDDSVGGDFKLAIDESDEAEETSSDLLPSKEKLAPKFVWPRKYTNKLVPWFIICMCCWQLFFYFVANDCVYNRFMLTPEHHFNQLWRYITYTLLHSDVMHLTLNICLQCVIGLILECEQGHARVAFVYAAGGVSGSLVTAFMQPQLSLLGASAAIYALLMSHIPHLTKNFPHLPHRFLRIISLIVLCLSDVVFTLFHFLVNQNRNPRICLEAHIAGAVTGLCLGFLIFKRVGQDGARKN